MLRETKNYTATKTARGVRITAKEPSSKRTMVVSLAIWKQLAPMNDPEFDGSCCLELGIGLFRK